MRGVLASLLLLPAGARSAPWPDVPGLPHPGTASVPPASARRALTGAEAWSRIPRVATQAAGMIVDPVRDRLVEFGGIDGDGNVSDDVWVKPLAGDTTWTRLDVPGPRPLARTAFAAVYDPVRERMIVFGDTFGDDPGGNVWALALSGAPAWTPLSPTGSGPGFRAGPAGIYDQVGDRLVIFGGYSAAADSDMNDVWALSLAGTPAWSRLLASGTPPSRRTLSSMQYDPAGQRLLVYGGWQDLRPATGEPVARDVWAMTLGDTPAWMELHPGGDVVPKLFECASAFDPLRGRMWLTGGLDSTWDSGPSPDTWMLQLGPTDTWARITPAGPRPLPGAGANVAIDGKRERLVLFGGKRSETWALPLASGSVWTLLEPGDGFGPGGRYAHSAVYDAARQRMLFFGGAFYDDGGGHHARLYTYADLWSLAFVPRPEWTPLAPGSPPPPGWGHSMILDPIADRLLVFGGTQPNPGDGPAEVMSDAVWQLPLAGADGAWSLLVPADSVPDARTQHTAVYDSTRRRMIVFGGTAPPNAFGDVWTLALDGPPRWTRLVVAGAGPSARYGHTAVYDPVGDRMIVFGGYDRVAALDDTWQLSLAGTPAWSRLSPDVRPPARLSASMVYDSRRQRVVLYGGSGSGLFDDTWVLPLADGANWMPADLADGSPDPREAASAVYAPDLDLVLVTGGRSTGPRQVVNISGSWMLASNVPLPAPMALAHAHAGPGRVVLEWRGAAEPAPAATVQRRTTAEAWTALGSARPQVGGVLTYEDATAVAATRYAYRLVWSAGASARTSDAAWVDVPGLHFALTGPMPNPTSRAVTVLFSLPDAAAARLEMTDVAGRRVVAREVGGLGPGDHALALTPPAALAPGVYFVRLTRGAESRTRRVCVIR